MVSNTACATFMMIIEQFESLTHQSEFDYILVNDIVVALIITFRSSTRSEIKLTPLVDEELRTILYLKYNVDNITEVSTFVISRSYASATESQGFKKIQNNSDHMFLTVS